MANISVGKGGQRGIVPIYADGMKVAEAHPSEGGRYTIRMASARLRDDNGQIVEVPLSGIADAYRAAIERSEGRD